MARDDALPWGPWVTGFLLGIGFGLLVGGALRSPGTGIAIGVLLAVPFAYGLGEVFRRRR